MRSDSSACDRMMLSLNRCMADCVLEIARFSSSERDKQEEDAHRSPHSLSRHRECISDSSSWPVRLYSSQTRQERPAGRGCRPRREIEEQSRRWRAAVVGTVTPWVARPSGPVLREALPSPPRRLQTTVAATSPSKRKSGGGGERGRVVRCDESPFAAQRRGDYEVSAAETAQALRKRQSEWERRRERRFVRCVELGSGGEYVACMRERSL